MTLVDCLHEFLTSYLPQIKGARDNTVKAYRDTFALFLVFASQQLKAPVKSLTLEQLSTDLLLAFLHHLEQERHNVGKTRNLRLAALKSLAKMIRLLHPEHRDIADRILSLPQKRVQKKLIGFFSPEEAMQVFNAVDLNRSAGFRDYCILHLLYDSGARASEVATLNLDYFDANAKTLAILGKGNRYRMVELWPKTVDLLVRYINEYRGRAKPFYSQRLFVNQRGEEFTRQGIYRLCKKYLSRALPKSKVKTLNPVHSFRHSCAMNMLIDGSSLTDIKNRLGHENIQSTMHYLQLDLTRKREIQKEFIAYTRGVLPNEQKLDDFLRNKSKEKFYDWLDSL